jgi:hypothetical protein
METTARTIINPALALQKPLEEYIQYLEKMTARSIPLLEKLSVPGMHYSDTKRDVRGVDDIIALFRNRFSRVRELKITVRDMAWGREGQTAYLRWFSTYEIDGVTMNGQGMSAVMFSDDGKVMSHTDYGDPCPVAFTVDPKPRYLVGYLRPSYWMDRLMKKS